MYQIYFILEQHSKYFYTFFYLLWRCDPTRVMASSFTRFLDHTQRSTTFGRTPLDEWSAFRRDLYLTTHNNHNRQTSMCPVGFELTISAGERPQTDSLDRAATGVGTYSYIYIYINIYKRLSQPKGHSAAGRIMSMEISHDTIGNRNRDLPICSAVPQPTAPPRFPYIYIYIYI
jgi:hypothetical protein